LRDKVKTIASGRSHSIALMKNNEIYSWGSGFFGQLGLGHTEDVSVATKMDFIFPALIETVVCGVNHTFALLCNSEVFCWGKNGHGQLGLGDRKNRLVPTKLTFTAPVKSLSCGGYHTFAFLKNGDIFCWGCNEEGQLGLDHRERVSLPTKFEFQFPARIKSLVCGWLHTVAHLINGEIFSWGSDYYGQLGLGGGGGTKSIPMKIEFPTQVKYVVCGTEHTVVQLTTNELYCWGQNDYGQLGVGDRKDKYVPIRLTFKFPAQVKQLVCGSQHTLALLQTGDVFSWGYNNYGQLGQGDTTDRTVPTQLRMNLPPGVSISRIYSEQNYCGSPVWTPETHVDFPSGEVQTPIFRFLQLNTLRMVPGYLPDLLTHEVCSYIAATGANSK
jgi:alpha-tubulin suppressor-like RCC1 family protein